MKKKNQSEYPWLSGAHCAPDDCILFICLFTLDAHIMDHDYVSMSNVGAIAKECVPSPSPCLNLTRLAFLYSIAHRVRCREGLC